jgi:hypothetical protein
LAAEAGASQPKTTDTVLATVLNRDGTDTSAHTVRDQEFARAEYRGWDEAMRRAAPQISAFQSPASRMDAPAPTMGVQI